MTSPAVMSLGAANAVPEVIVHGHADAEAALAAAEALGLAIRLTSATGAGAFAGPGWFRAVTDRAQDAHPGACLDIALDCGTSAGAALAALRHGIARIRFDGPAEAFDRLADIGRARGAVVERPPATSPLDLFGIADPRQVCTEYFTEFK